MEEKKINRTTKDFLIEAHTTVVLIVNFTAGSRSILLPLGTHAVTSQHSCANFQRSGRLFTNSATTQFHGCDIVSRPFDCCSCAFVRDHGSDTVA